VSFIGIEADNVQMVEGSAITNEYGRCAFDEFVVE